MRKKVERNIAELLQEWESMSLEEKIEQARQIGTVPPETIERLRWLDEWRRRSVEKLYGGRG